MLIFFPFLTGINYSRFSATENLDSEVLMADLDLSTSLAFSQLCDLRQMMAFVRFSFLSCTSPAGLRGLRVEQVYKTPKAGSVTPHALRKWSLSSCVTSSHGSDSSPGSRRVGIHSEGAEQQIEVRGRGGTRPGGHTLAGQPPGLQISASQFGLPVLPGRESASGGSPFPGPSPTDCSLPAAPHSRRTPA